MSKHSTKSRRDTIKDFAPMLGLSGIGVVLLRSAFGATGMLGGALMAVLLVVFSLAESRSDAAERSDPVSSEQA